MAKPKLHELIAVEGELEGTAKKIIDEASVTFSKKPDHFLSMRREVRMLSDAPEAIAENTVEMTALTTTVGDKLDYVGSHLIRYWDAVLQKETTNGHAKADLVVDGTVVGKDLPATFLLGMENRLKAVRAMYEDIPTLAPGKTWIPDETNALKGVFLVRDDDVRVRTKKLAKPVVLYQATKEHPAQVKEVVEDVPVGHVTVRNWSSMISPADKSDMLGRIDKLIRACKKARQRANSTEVVRMTVGKVLIDFVNKGTFGGAALSGDDTVDADT